MTEHPAGPDEQRLHLLGKPLCYWVRPDDPTNVTYTTTDEDYSTVGYVELRPVSAPPAGSEPEQRYYAQPMQGRDGVWEVIDRFGADKYPDGSVFATAEENAEARAREYAADANGYGADSAELMRVARRLVNKWVEMSREYRSDSDSNELGELLDQLEDEVRRV